MWILGLRLYKYFPASCVSMQFGEPEGYQNGG